MGRITDVRLRRGTAAAWTSANPVLGAGEPGLETDTFKIKFGNGSLPWLSLPYIAGDAAGSGLNTLDPPGAWAGWRNGVSNMANEHLRWLAIGDSITEGTGSTGGHPSGWVYQVGQRIRQAFPTIQGNAVDGQLGWTPTAQTSSSVPSVWTPAGSYGTGSNFGFRNTKSTSIMSSATLTATITGTHVDVWWTQGPATAAFTVLVNGVTKATFGTSSASVTSGYKGRVQLGASATVPGTYTVVIKANAAASASFINGVTVYNGNDNSGFVTFNAGVHGYKTSDWVTSTNHANWRQDYVALRPHLVTVMLGANDYSSLVGQDAFRANLTTIVNNLRDYTLNTVWPTILLISCYKENYTFAPRWEYYQYTMEQVARDMNCAFLDLRTVMPDPGSAEAIAADYYAEAIHPNNTGYQKLALEVGNLLLARAANPNLTPLA
jgi:lysophospholipase L1-like esterase